MVLYARAPFSEKISLLFDLFDFNQLNYLFLLDIEFMLRCCSDSATKIVRSAEGALNEDIGCSARRPSRRSGR